MSKNTLNQLTPEQKQTVISWIEADPDRKSGKPSAITRIRNQFNIEVSSEELADFAFDWHFQNVQSEAVNGTQKQANLLKSLKALSQDRLQQAALSLLYVHAMKSDNHQLLLQVAKLSHKREELELKKAILMNPPCPSLGAPAFPQSRDQLAAGQVDLPASPLPLGSLPSASSSPTSAFSIPPLALSSPAPSLTSLLAARTAEYEKTRGPLTNAVVTEIAQSILDDSRKSVKRPQV